MKVKQLYEFGGYRLDITERLLLRDGKPVEVTAKVFDLLVLLVENQGKLLEKNTILETLWPDNFVEEVNLSVNISALRKALGEQAAAPTFIETVPKRGYRFIAPVTPLAETTPDDASADVKPIQETNYISEAPINETAPASQAVGFGRKFRLRLLMAGLGILVIALIAFYFSRTKSPRVTSVASATPRTIAVLPFKSLAQSDADQSLGMGMADALITRLGSFREMVVRPTSAVMKYNDAATDPLSAGRELQVEAVLEGRVQRDGKTIRVTAQLLRVADGASLWSGKFDDFFTNVFALQDSISEKMMETLSVSLSQTDQQLLTKRQTENTEAFQLYVQGRYFYYQYKFDKSLEFLLAAIEKDPSYPLAYSGLALDYLALSANSHEREMFLGKALEAANQALRLDPNLGEAHNAMGWIEFLGNWNWTGAEQGMKRAIELNPNDADAHINFGTVLCDLGRFDEGVRESEKAIQLDPVTSDTNFQCTLNLYLARRYDHAMAQYQKAVEVDPNNPRLQSLLIRLYVAKGMYEQAIAEGKKQGSKLPTIPFLAFAYARLGRRAEAEQIAKTFLPPAGKLGSNFLQAILDTALGNKEKALEALEKGFAARDNLMIHLKVDPAFDNLRAEPRFQELLRKMRLES